MKMKAMWGVVATTALAIGMLTGGAVAASATDVEPDPTEVCTPSDAWTEVVDDISHAAVYETVIVTPAVIGSPAVWANFSPNDSQATFIGPATYPADGRGTWNDHGTLPPGQAGPDGVYANGDADKGGNWFYRKAAVPAADAVTEQRLVTAAYTEVVPDIEHPAVVCDEPVDEPDVIQEWHTWETELEDGVTTPTTADDVTWPQDYVGPGQLTPPCGIWYQQDLYEGTAEDIDAVIEDGVLDGLPPEDSGIVIDWVFVYGGDCPPPVIGVPALYSADPLPPNCDTAGSFSLDGDPTPNVDVTVYPALDGPGIYTLTATALNGYTFEGGGTVKTRTIEILGATGFQSDDPEVACYLEPEEPPVDNPPVDNPPVDNPPVVTPAVVVVKHTTTTVPAASTTKTLAVTGGEETPWLPIGGLALVLSGIGTLIWRRVRA